MPGIARNANATNNGDEGHIRHCQAVVPCIGCTAVISSPPSPLYLGNSRTYHSIGTEYVRAPIASPFLTPR